MHFISVLTNIALWAILGSCIGETFFVLQKEDKKKKNMFKLKGAAAAMAGGLFATLCLGTGPIGLNAVNLFVALLVSTAVVVFPKPLKRYFA